MRIYANCKEAINEIKRNLYEMGIEVFPNSMQNKIVKDDENFKTKELQNECFTIIDTKDKDILVGSNLEWCHAEFKERVSREECNPGEAWLLRKQVWEPFMKEGLHDYTYADRMGYQLDKVIAEMKVNQDTRQAVIELHNNILDIDSLGGKKRIPCSMFYLAQIRKDGNGVKKLNLTYAMRSCDYYSHFKQDIWLAAELRDYLAKEVGVEPGVLTLNIASLHMYKKDWESGVY